MPNRGRAMEAENGSLQIQHFFGSKINTLRPTQAGIHDCLCYGAVCGRRYEHRTLQYRAGRRGSRPAVATHRVSHTIAKNVSTVPSGTLIGSSKAISNPRGA